MTIRKYSELRRLTSFEERYKYLQLFGQVGFTTFGFDRYINQKFYRSAEWRRIRDYVIARDEGFDLGVDGYEIHGRILIHHMNPMSPEDIIHAREQNLDPEFLISVTHDTHNAIHYGDESLLAKPPVVRLPGDTKLW